MNNANTILQKFFYLFSGFENGFSWTYLYSKTTVVKCWKKKKKRNLFFKFLLFHHFKCLKSKNFDKKFSNSIFGRVNFCSGFSKHCLHIMCVKKKTEFLTIFSFSSIPIKSSFNNSAAFVQKHTFKLYNKRKKNFDF